MFKRLCLCLLLLGCFAYSLAYGQGYITPPDYRQFYQQNAPKSGADYWKNYKPSNNSSSNTEPTSSTTMPGTGVDYWKNYKPSSSSSYGEDFWKNYKPGTVVSQPSQTVYYGNNQYQNAAASNTNASNNSSTSDQPVSRSYWESCNWCHGSGQCSSCNGSGILRDNMFGTGRTSPCPNCEHNHNGVCSHCHGSKGRTVTVTAY